MEMVNERDGNRILIIVVIGVRDNDRILIRTVIRAKK